MGNPYPNVSAFFEYREPNLDATKDMGYIVRDSPDQNLYGSAISRDSFDDESES